MTIWFNVTVFWGIRSMRVQYQLKPTSADTLVGQISNNKKITETNWHAVSLGFWLSLDTTSHTLPQWTKSAQSFGPFADLVFLHSCSMGWEKGMSDLKDVPAEIFREAFHPSSNFKMSLFWQFDKNRSTKAPLSPHFHQSVFGIVPLEAVCNPSLMYPNPRSVLGFHRRQ